MLEICRRMLVHLCDKASASAILLYSAASSCSFRHICLTSSFWTWPKSAEVVLAVVARILTAV